MPKSDSTSKKVASSVSKVLRSKTASKAVKSVAASALTHRGGSTDGKIEQLEQRIAELESMLQAKIGMLNFLAQEAGYVEGDTFSGYDLVKRLRERKDN